MKNLRLLFLGLIIPFTFNPSFEIKSEEINNECGSLQDIQEFKKCITEKLSINQNLKDIEDDPEFKKIETDTSFEEASIAFKEHRENDALSKINYYLSKNPNSKEGYLLRALISGWDFDDQKQALQDLTKAIEIDQNFAEAYAWRAEIFNYDFSNLKSAENDIQKALELSPNDPIVNFNASGVYQEKAYKNLKKKGHPTTNLSISHDTHNR